MRIVKADKGIQFKVRPLTFGEMFSLRVDDGIEIPKLKKDDAEAAIYRVFEVVLSEHDFHELKGQPYPFALKLFDEVCKETYGSRDEEKN